jgi:YVTN family beta-propeller protein
VATQSVSVTVVRPGRSTLAHSVAATLFAPTRVYVAGGPYGMSVAASGLVYATRLYDGAVAVGSVSSKTVTGAINVGVAPTGVTINPAGTEAYVTNQLSSNLGVIDVATSTQVATIPLGWDPFVVAFSGNGATAYVATNQGMVYSISTATRAKTDSVMTGNGSNGLAIAPNGQRVYVSAFAAGRIYEIDLASFDVLRTFITNFGIPQGIVVSQDGTELYVADQNGAVQVWNLAAGTRTTSIPVANGGFGLAASPNGATLYATSMTGWVSQVDRATRTVTRAFYVGGDPRRIGVSADGLTLAVANLNGWIDFITP